MGESPPKLRAAAATSWPELLAPFDLSRLRCTLSSRPLTPQRLGRLLALPLSPATSLLLLQWYAASHPVLSSLPLRPLLATADADPERALSLLEPLPSTRCPPLRETHLIPLLRSLPPGRVLHLLDQLPSRFAVSPSFRSYNTVLAALARANFHADVLALYRRMVHRDRIPPTTFTFGVAARALCRLGRADEALAMLRSMAGHGCVPDVVLYQTVIHALCEQGEVAEATTLLDEMFLMGCSADVNTFNDIVHGLCMLGRLREAARLVDRMMIRGCLPNTMTYGFLIQGLCRARQVDEARTMLGRVPELNVVLFNTVIAGCLLDGKLTEATELYEIMGSKGCPPDAHTYKAASSRATLLVVFFSCTTPRSINRVSKNFWMACLIFIIDHSEWPPCKQEDTKTEREVDCATGHRSAFHAKGHT
ncbi:hypothetical protein ZWY2020_009060 [Hordeum vulgare]|nr:hypothetical protein ZWY2020_009060 [Hordeum vulgare]